MIYPYFCAKCDEKFEVVKSHRDIDRSEPCPTCQELTGDRRIGLVRLQGVEREEYFHYGLGKVIRNKSHLRNEMAALRYAGKDMVEVGDEPVAKIEKKFAAERKEKREKRWSEPVDKILQDVMHGR